MENYKNVSKNNIFNNVLALISALVQHEIQENYVLSIKLCYKNPILITVFSKNL